MGSKKAAKPKKKAAKKKAVKKKLKASDAKISVGGKVIEPVSENTLDVPPQHFAPTSPTSVTEDTRSHADDEIDANIDNGVDDDEDEGYF
jgi:hypothetical protein